MPTQVGIHDFPTRARKNRVGAPLAERPSHTTGLYGSRTTAVSDKVQCGMMVGHPDQPECVEPRNGHRLLGLLAIGLAPPPFARRSQLEGIAARHAIPDQEPDHRADVLAAFELDAAQLATEPSVEVAQRALTPGVAVGRYPACDEAVHLLDHPLQGTVPPVATGDLAQAILGAGQTFAPDAKCAAASQTMAEELTFPNRGNRALLPVDLEPQPVFQERRHRRHHPLARRLRPHVDVAVVRVPAEAVPPAFQLLVQVVQQQIGAYSDEGGHRFRSDRGHDFDLIAARLVSSRRPVLVMSRWS